MIRPVLTRPQPCRYECIAAADGRLSRCMKIDRVMAPKIAGSGWGGICDCIAACQPHDEWEEQALWLSAVRAPHLEAMECSRRGEQGTAQDSFPSGWESEDALLQCRSDASIQRCACLVDPNRHYAFATSSTDMIHGMHWMPAPFSPAL